MERITLNRTSADSFDIYLQGCHEVLARAVLVNTVWHINGVAYSSSLGDSAAAFEDLIFRTEEITVPDILIDGVCTLAVIALILLAWAILS